MLSVAPGVVIAFTAALEATAVVLDLNTIILASIGLAGTCVTGFIAIRLGTLAAAQKEAKETGDKTAETMKDIHIAVNSKETATAKRIDEQNALILELSKTVKTLEEKLRGNEVAKAVADAVRVPVPVVLQQVAAPAEVKV